MKRRRREGIFFLMCFWILVGLSVEGQVVSEALPLHGVPLLSGGFGELRSTHFHSGVDLKTGGRTGLAVLCVKDGLLARVKVSSTGYGKALYMEHADGTTTVYGHLEQFNGKITRIVRERQYRQESFAVDLEDAKQYGLFFRRGDTLAWSGNTGSSGGPHLHFEYRDTRSERLINPLHYFSIKDQIAPVIRSLYLYAVTDSGRVRQLRTITPQRVGSRRYAGGQIVVPAGRIGVGFYLTDAMNDSWNKLGVYKLRLEVDDRVVFQLQADTASFDQNRLVNDLKDYTLYQEKGQTVYRCFGNFVSRILGVECIDKGHIKVEKGEEIPVRVEVSDINGNRSEMSFKLRGGEKLLPEDKKIVHYEQSHLLQEGPYSLELKAGALFSSVERVVRTDTLTDNEGMLRNVFVTAEKEVPLSVNSVLRVQGKYDTRTVICRIGPGQRLAALPTFRDEESIYSFVPVLGRYTVVLDSVPPEIIYKGRRGDRFRFQIKDLLSGIASWRGEVNGKWTLFEYDMKSGMLWCKRNEPAFVKGKSNRIRLSVTDGAGNKAQCEIKVEITPSE